MEKIDELLEEVINEFGKSFPLRIAEDAPSAYFDWEKVTIPKRFLEWDKKMLKNVLRHEFGHLFFSPRDPDTGIIIWYIANVMGYNQPWFFVNIFTDMIVDMTNMELFGTEYLRFLEWSIGKIKNPPKLIKIMAGVYREKARYLGLRTRFASDDLGKIIYKIY